MNGFWLGSGLSNKSLFMTIEQPYLFIRKKVLYVKKGLPLAHKFIKILTQNKHDNFNVSSKRGDKVKKLRKFEKQ